MTVAERSLVLNMVGLVPHRFATTLSYVQFVQTRYPKSSTSSLWIANVPTLGYRKLNSRQIADGSVRKMQTVPSQLSLALHCSIRTTN